MKHFIPLTPNQLQIVQASLQLSLKYADSQSEGKDYGSKVDALVDSMGVTDQEVSTTHRRRDLDTL